MASFVQLAWIWLLLGSLLLLLAGCLLLPKPAPSETPNSSSHPSMSFTLVPFSTENLQLRYLEPTLNYIYTPTSNITQRQVSPPTEDDYYATIPNCVSSPNGGYSCLGRVWNNSSQASGSILLSINLLNEQKQIINKQTIASEQRLVPSQEFAPYRLIIPPMERPYQELETRIETVIPLDSQMQNLQVIDSRGQMTAVGRYRLTTTILNNVGDTVKSIRLFASLVDEEEQVVGYRIYEVGETMAEGERRVIELEIIPQIIPETIHHELHVEGSIFSE
jgi:hypothetical protein